MLLFIDNFDSFTYNLVQAFQSLKVAVHVVRNNALTVQQCLDLNPTHVVIGPGPGTPSGAGISKDLIRACAIHRLPLLGVCLGHQALAEVYGGVVTRAVYPMHGKTSLIFHNERFLFKDFPQAFAATRYHSLIVENQSLPSCLEITAETKAKEIMGLCHKRLPLYSVQFHPESVLTEGGLLLFMNFLDNSSFQI